MKIMWHGAIPPDEDGFGMPTGYGNQARVWLPRLHKAGHEIAISSLAGITSHMGAWKIPGSASAAPMFPCTPYETQGQDVIRGHYEQWGADLLFSLTCTWVYNPLAWRDMRTVFITPVDVDGMSVKDYNVIFTSGGTPAAVCRWGETQMRSRNLDPLYLPHGIETGRFKPPRNRRKLRQGLGVDQHFLVGVNAANHERTRKNFNEIFGAFARFHKQHPKSLLMLHTLGMLPEGLNMWQMTDWWGISDACVFSDQYQMIIGQVGWDELAAWYGALDVLIMVGNEGFGLPTVEAMACGTPVIGGNWGPTPELLDGTGWLVDQPQLYWNNWHGKQWRVPVASHTCSSCGHEDGLAAVLEQAYEQAHEQRGAARKAALKWDADMLFDEYWQPVLKDLNG